MYVLSSSDSGDMRDTRVPTALLPELFRTGRAHVTSLIHLCIECDRSKARWLKSVGWVPAGRRQASVKRWISDRRDAELDPSVRQHDDEFRTAPQIEMR